MSTLRVVVSNEARERRAKELAAIVVAALAKEIREAEVVHFGVGRRWPD
jgi:hypothetical protein